MLVDFYTVLHLKSHNDNFNDVSDAPAGYSTTSLGEKRKVIIEEKRFKMKVEESCYEYESFSASLLLPLVPFMMITGGI